MVWWWLMVWEAEGEVGDHDAVAVVRVRVPLELDVARLRFALRAGHVPQVPHAPQPDHMKVYIFT